MANNPLPPELQHIRNQLEHAQTHFAQLYSQAVVAFSNHGLVLEAFITRTTIIEATTFIKLPAAKHRSKIRERWQIRDQHLLLAFGYAALSVQFIQFLAHVAENCAPDLTWDVFYAAISSFKHKRLAGHLTVMRVSKTKPWTPHDIIEAMVALRIPLPRFAKKRKIATSQAQGSDVAQDDAFEDSDQSEIDIELGRNVISPRSTTPTSPEPLGVSTLFDSPVHLKSIISNEEASEDRQASFDNNAIGSLGEDNSNSEMVATHNVVEATMDNLGEHNGDSKTVATCDVSEATVDSTIANKLGEYNDDGATAATHDVVEATTGSIMANKVCVQRGKSKPASLIHDSDRIESTLRVLRSSTAWLGHTTIEQVLKPFYSPTVQVWDPGNVPSDRSVLECWQPKINLRLSTQHAIMVANVGNHWILLHLDCTSRRLYIFDSLRSPQSQGHIELVAERIPQQVDYNDCGVFSLIFSLSLIAKRPIPSTFHASSRLYRWIFYWLVKNQKVPLQEANNAIEIVSVPTLFQRTPLVYHTHTDIETVIGFKNYVIGLRDGNVGLCLDELQLFLTALLDHVTETCGSFPKPADIQQKIADLNGFTEQCKKMQLAGIDSGAIIAQIQHQLDNIVREETQRHIGRIQKVLAALRLMRKAVDELVDKGLTVLGSEEARVASERYSSQLYKSMIVDGE
ncbi:hypothetical protein BLS_002920 [Venturia inaequalis]|uniref:Ubiquitin-like protease family profile domain-containing protein n=1 Tax=Venturia inaequalis TaxID=5025 RepID=A0A8H3YUW6_VENIN|nr:hypothetical protein BLS_002920 [Venturia inaequalis]